MANQKMKKTENKSKWNDIGTLRFRKTEDGTKVPYLVLDKGVKLLVGTFDKTSGEHKDFQEVDLGQYRTVKCMSATAGLDALLAKGFIDEAEHAKRLEQIETKSIGYKLSIPPSES